jgi:predicted DNA-binding transcriptional regulator YafY
LLGLLAGRCWWTAAELAAEIDVTERTVRRDITRLRDLGYPIDGTTGPYGGYSLGRGGHLPPLVLDDDEAVAVAVALRQSAGGGVASPAAALGALTKLEQLLPAPLRERVVAVAEMTVGLQPPGPAGSRAGSGAVETLVAAALAARRLERLRFRYTAGTGEESERLVEPLRLVQSDRRWYLVAFDPSRGDWRTFRVDRMAGAALTGHRFVAQPDPPDPAALVARGLASAGYDVSARVRLFVPAGEAVRLVPPSVGVLEPAGPGDDPAESVIMVIGGSLDWLARYLAGLHARFEILDPPELVRALRRHARQLTRHAMPTGAGTPR